MTKLKMTIREKEILAKGRDTLKRIERRGDLAEVLICQEKILQLRHITNWDYHVETFGINYLVDRIGDTRKVRALPHRRDEKFVNQHTGEEAALDTPEFFDNLMADVYIKRNCIITAIENAKHTPIELLKTGEIYIFGNIGCCGFGAYEREMEKRGKKVYHDQCVANRICEATEVARKELDAPDGLKRRLHMIPY